MYKMCITNLKDALIADKVRDAVINAEDDNL